jgi:hypothetical protein
VTTFKKAGSFWEDLKKALLIYVNVEKWKVKGLSVFNRKDKVHSKVN